MSALPVTDINHWHAIRAQHVGASEVAALFGASPYMSKFTLWHQKKGTLPTPDLDSDRVDAGNRLEPVIAQWHADRQGWKVQKVHRYMQHRRIKGMGTSLDYEVIDHTDGPGVLEIKNVDRIIWHQGWFNEDGEIEPPLHIELQLQHQLAVSGRQWGAIGALIGGNQPEIIIRKRHDAIIGKIEQAVAAFWQSIAEDKEPPITGSEDYATIAAIYRQAREGELVDLSDNKEALELCQILADCSAKKKHFEDQIKAAKARLLPLIGDAETAIIPGFKVSAKTISRGAYTVEATSYRDLRVKQAKEATK